MDRVLLRVKNYRSRSGSLDCEHYQAVAKHREMGTAATAAYVLTLTAQRDICFSEAELIQGSAALNFMKIMQERLN